MIIEDGKEEVEHVVVMMMGKKRLKKGVVSGDYDIDDDVGEGAVEDECSENF